MPIPDDLRLRSDKNGEYPWIYNWIVVFYQMIWIVCKSSEENLTDCDCDDYESSSSGIK